MNKLNLYGAFALALVCFALVPTKTTLAQPVNDDYSNAILIACGQQQSGNTESATASSAQTPCNGQTPSPDLWYMHLGGGECVTASLCTGTTYDANLNVYRLDGAELTCVGGNSDWCGTAPGLSYTATDGDLFLIQVGGDNAETGSFTLELSCGNTPVNDQPCSAASLPIGLPKMISNICASADANEPSPGVGSGSNSCTSADGWCEADAAVQNSVWYRFIAPASGCVSLTLDGGANLQVAVYATANCNSYDEFTLVKANDDDPSGEHAAVIDRVSCLEPGTEYFIQVDGFLGDAGTGAIELQDCGNNPLHIEAMGDYYRGFIGVEFAMEGNFLLAQPRGGFAPYTYDWDGEAVTEINGASMEYTPAAEGDLYFTATITDAEGCQAMLEYTVDIINVDCSPTGDGSKVAVHSNDPETGDLILDCIDVTNDTRTEMFAARMHFGHDELPSAYVPILWEYSIIKKLCGKTAPHTPDFCISADINCSGPTRICSMPNGKIAAEAALGTGVCDYEDNTFGTITIAGGYGLEVYNDVSDAMEFHLLDFKPGSRLRWRTSDLQLTGHPECPDISVCGLKVGWGVSHDISWHKFFVDYISFGGPTHGGDAMARYAGQPPILTGSGTVNLDPLMAFTNEQGLPECGDCFSGDSKNPAEQLKIKFLTDEAAEETSFKLMDMTTNEIVLMQDFGDMGSGANLEYEVCTKEGHCYEFRLYDAAGNGICCENGEGFYSISYLGKLYTSPSEGNFGESETIVIGACAPPKKKRDFDTALETQGARVVAYPNPFSDNTTIAFTVPEATTATLEVFDLAGHRVGVLYQGPLSANQPYNVQFDANNLNDGVYFYKFSTSSGINYQNKIVLLR